MLYLVDLEPVETRYTAQWRQHLPKQLKEAGIETWCDPRIRVGHEKIRVI